MLLASRHSPARNTCHYWCGNLALEEGPAQTVPGWISASFPSFFVVLIGMLTREVAVSSLNAADLMGSSGTINTLRGSMVSGSSADVLSIVAFKIERANHSVRLRCAVTLP